MLKNSLLFVLAIAFLLCVVSTSAVSFQKTAAGSCQVCTSITLQMENIVQAGKGLTEDQIIAGLEKFCSSLPSQDQQQCQNIVADVKTQILDGLFSLEDPTQYCTELKLCPDVVYDQCTVCEMFATQSEKAIAAGEGVTEDQIVAWINDVCSKLPQNQQGRCRTYSADVKTKVLDGLYSQEDVTQYCTGLGACKSSAYVLPEPRVRQLIVAEAEAPEANEECDACKIVAAVAEVLIKRENVTESEVLKTLENVCTALGTLEKECKAVVLLVGRKVLKGLFDGETPVQVCEGVSLCSKNSTSSAVQTIVTPEQRKLSMNEWNNVINRKARRLGLKRKAEKVERD